MSSPTTQPQTLASRRQHAWSPGLQTILILLLAILPGLPVLTRVIAHSSGTGSYPVRKPPLLNTAGLSYGGPDDLQQALNQARTRSLAAGDFDEDGMPDLVSGYENQGRGIVSLARGNLNAIYPHSPEAQQQRRNGSFTDEPFLSPAVLFATPAAADFMGTGDFDGDSHWDVVVASRGRSSLYLLSGNGQGGLGPAQEIPLPGIVTAMIVGDVNRRDGLNDVLVGIEGPDGFALLVFEGPEGALRAQPETFRLTAQVNAVALGQLDGDSAFDLVVATGKELQLIHGRDRKLTLDEELQRKVPAAHIDHRYFSSRVVSLEVGHFHASPDDDIAVCTEDGEVLVLSSTAAKRENQPGTSTDNSTELAAWESFAVASIESLEPRQLGCMRISGLPEDELVVTDSTRRQLHILNQDQFRNSAPTSGPGGVRRPTHEPVTVELLSGNPVAVLPMHLNADALDDLVILDSDEARPSVVMTGPGGPQVRRLAASSSDETVFTADQPAEIKPSFPGCATHTIFSGVTVNGNLQGDCNADSRLFDIYTFSGVAGQSASISMSSTAFNSYLYLLKSDGTFLGQDDNGGGGNNARIPAGSGTISLPITDTYKIYATTPTANATGSYTILLTLGGCSGAQTVVTNTNDSGAGSLRSAILTANACPGPNTITFSIGTGAKTITPLSALPDITEAATIDGTTQPGFAGSPLIEVNGVSAGNANGLHVTGGSSTIQGLVINRFHGAGIRLDTAGGNIVRGNYIGTNAAGSAVSANTGDGLIMDGSSNNTIGGTISSARNVISGNSLSGISIQSCSGNVVQGNYLGTDATGVLDLGNDSGVYFYNSQNNLLGGTSAGARNIISGNNSYGIVGFGFPGVVAHDNLIQANYIGLKADGAGPVSNRFGIYLQDVASTTIGGTTVAARNVISGNETFGVQVQGSVASNNVIQGNYVGTNAAGIARVGNHGGVYLLDKLGILGGSIAGARNIISGNFDVGVTILTNGAHVEGNYIGVDINGTALGNTDIGIYIFNSDNNVIGGLTANSANVISGNGSAGIAMYGGDSNFGPANNARFNIVQGNLIGTDPTGTQRRGNGHDGVQITQATDNTIGGSSPQARNIISANSGNGIAVGIRLTDPFGGSLLPGTGGRAVTIEGNYIGTDITGNICLGNSLNGVLVDADSLIDTIRGNLIACNGINGVNIPDNSNPGVQILLDSNSVFKNTALGINLGAPGVTPNDPLDADVGANLQQNFPVLASFGPAQLSGKDKQVLAPEQTASTISVNGSLNSAPNTTYIIQWYFTADLQCTNNQQASRQLAGGRIPNVRTAANGNAAFVFSLPFPLGVTTGVVNSQAIEQLTGNTSEFSSCLRVSELPSIAIADFTAFEGNSGTTPFTFAVGLSSPAANPVTVNYATAPGSASGSDYQSTSGTLTFNPGETSKSITVQVNGDSTFEPDEIFNVNLSGASQATIADAQAVGTILNDDASLQFSNATYGVNEGGISAPITVTRTGSTAAAAKVDFAVSDGSATQNQDYVVTSGTLNFAAGETSKTFDVLIVNDAFVESAQTINLTVSNATGGTLGTPSTATLTINDNDTAGSPSPAAKRYSAFLEGAQETPANNSNAKGTGYVLLNGNETSASVSLQFQGLGSAETAAHIHGAGAPGVSAPILFTLPTTNPVTSFQISPTAQQVADLKAGMHYLNVHSTNFQNGEIRGQLRWNPTLEENFFVRQQYLDFLSRDGDPGGFGFWVNQVGSCGADAQCLHDRTITTSNAFFFEPEFQQTAGYVFRAYRAAFGNNQPFPNPDGSNATEANKLIDYAAFVADRARVVGGADLASAQQAFANQFVLRSQFSLRYAPPLSGPQFVDAILLTIQTADNVNLTSQRQALIDQYNNAGGGNAGRAMVLYRLADDNSQNPINNQTFINAEYNRQFALTLYFGYLRRNPDIGGFLFWQSQINLAAVRDVPKQNALVCSFLTAAEYQLRFGPNAPRSNAECPQ